jgi:hypothetical protein
MTADGPADSEVVDLACAGATGAREIGGTNEEEGRPGGRPSSWFRIRQRLWCTVVST